MNFLQKFMYGRYGGDQLGRFTMVLYLVLYFAALLLDRTGLYLLSFITAGITLFRLLSRNIPKRQEENRKFLAKTAPIRSWWRGVRQRSTDKDHKYFKCPHCGQRLRVPRGRGTIRVTCRVCGTVFEEKC